MHSNTRRSENTAGVPIAARTTIVQPEAVEWFDAIPGERLSIRVRGEQVGRRFAVMESVAGPGAAAPLHTHVEDEVFLVLDGTATFRLGNVIVDVGAGGHVIIPANTPHAWKNRSDVDVRMIAIFGPAGVERMFEQIAGLSPEGIAAKAAEYGTVVLGPPAE